MMRDVEDLRCVAIADLVPTQVTVGMREVDFKRRRWREIDNHHDATAYLSDHRIPVVLGPGVHRYIIDRHHLTRALHEEGIEKVPTVVVSDLSALGFDEFWFTLESRSWAHPFDAEGNRRSYGNMPKTVADLTDDLFRSLSGALKRSGGYAKNNAPFSEFLWADFLRSRIAIEGVERDFDGALMLALNLSRSMETRFLPGWLGSASNRHQLKSAFHYLLPCMQ